MKKESAMLLTTLLLVSVFAPMAFSTGPTQPPVDTTTMYVGTIAWGPRYADPVRAYDTASGELIFNIYDTLISMGEPIANSWKPQGWDVQEQYWAFSPSLSTNVPDRVAKSTTITSDDVDPKSPQGSTWSDNSVLLSWIDKDESKALSEGDVVSMQQQGDEDKVGSFTVKSFVEDTPSSMTLENYSYSFRIRTSPVINFYDNTGAVVDTFDVYDAEYSFKRGLVQDQYGSPMWMFYKPFFDQMNSDFWDTGNPADAVTLSHLIANTVEVSGNNLTINLGIAFPDTAFKQILTQTWGSIVSKEWAIGKGCWNGDLFVDANANGYPDWFEPYPIGWRHISAGNVPISAVIPQNYAGTGPYHVITASADLNLVVLERNPGYWQGWPAPDRKAFLEYVDIEYIADWPTRREAFKAGQLDVAAVPRAFMLELLDPADPAYMTSIFQGLKTIKNVGPVLGEGSMFFTFTLDPTTPAIYTGSFPEGVPTDFFNNTHVRRAFAYAFNHTQYLNEVWLGEAIARQTPDIFGLVPDYYSLPDANGLGPWTYDLNVTAMKSELEQAMFTQLNTTSGLIETHSVWNWGGFHVDIFYNAGNEQGRLACEFIQASFNVLNTVYWKNFQVTVQGLDWATYLDRMETYFMPAWFMDWYAGFADADACKRPCMHSQGDFAYFQGYRELTGWTTVGPQTGLTKDKLIDLAARTIDGSDRAKMYADLDCIYVNDVPSFTVAQGLARRWCWYWVKGWYYNALYPSQYYYKLYKEQTCWADVTGIIVGIPDGVCSMRDIGYIANHFGAKAPNPTNVPPALDYDPKWAPGTYPGCDVYGDRKVDMRDIGFACAHFGHATQP